MANRKRGNRGFAVFIAVLVIFLILAIALFVYGSMNNGLPQPRLPGQPKFALRMMCWHG